LTRFELHFGIVPRGVKLCVKLITFSFAVIHSLSLSLSHSQFLKRELTMYNTALRVRIKQRVEIAFMITHTNLFLTNDNILKKENMED
jgi:uncharacterized membrane protein